MRTLQKITVIAALLFAAATAFAEVNVGVDVNFRFGHPRPRVEVVPVCPYPGGIWVGGYWNLNPVYHHYVWVPGYWRRPAYRPVVVERPYFHRRFEHFDRGEHRGYRHR